MENEVKLVIQFGGFDRKPEIVRVREVGPTSVLVSKPDGRGAVWNGCNPTFYPLGAKTKIEEFLKVKKELEAMALNLKDVPLCPTRDDLFRQKRDAEEEARCEAVEKAKAEREHAAKEKRDKEETAAIAKIKAGLVLVFGDQVTDERLESAIHWAQVDFSVHSARSLIKRDPKFEKVTFEFTGLIEREPTAKGLKV